MTNQHLVAEINRQIRGIAINFPDGISAIRAQLDLVAPIAPPVVRIASTVADESQVPVKRGPGRPRKQPV